MNHIGLFEGIGGFSLAAEWMGWETIAWCEINGFCQKILKQHFPKAIGHGDIKTTDFSIYRGQCDIVTGGFPCQPFSSAGNRKGTEDNRYLWPEMLRAIREISPRWIVGENVRGLTNWNGGLVFDQVQADLEAEGYEVLPFLLPACAVNAPHRRDRIWFVAHRIEVIGISRTLETKGQRNRQRILGTRESGRQKIELQSKDIITPDPDSNGHQSGGFGESGSAQSQSQSQQNKREWIRGDIGGIGESGDAANSNSGLGCKRGLHTSESETTKRYAGSCDARGHERGGWNNFPTQPPIRHGNDGISDFMVRNIKSEIYVAISEKYGDEDLQKMWEAFSEAKIRKQIGGLYKIHEPALLLKTVQLCKAGSGTQVGFSLFSEEISEPLLRKLRQYESFGCTPQGLECKEQFNREFANSLPRMSHEVALATKEIEKTCRHFSAKWRNESIKALGNTIVPQVAFQIFKAIQQYERSNKPKKTDAATY